MEILCYVRGETCGELHHRTIAYGEYGTGFVCDRCGYGYNTFDILYKCVDKLKDKPHECKESDLCCKCAIKLANAWNQDMDVPTEQQQHLTQDNIYNLINIPVINTRFVHQGKNQQVRYHTNQIVIIHSTTTILKAQILIKTIMIKYRTRQQLRLRKQILLN